MAKEFKIVGKNKETVETIHEQLVDSRKGMSRLMLNRLMVISKNSDGASIKLRDKNLSRFIKDDDVVSRIEEGFPNNLEKGKDYEIEVLQ